MHCYVLSDAVKARLLHRQGKLVSHDEIDAVCHPAFAAIVTVRRAAAITSGMAAAFSGELACESSVARRCGSRTPTAPRAPSRCVYPVIQAHGSRVCHPLRSRGGFL